MNTDFYISELARINDEMIICIKQMTINNDPVVQIQSSIRLEHLLMMNKSLIESLALSLNTKKDL